MDNHSKKYPVDNTLRNVVHTTSNTSNVYNAAKDFFDELFMLIVWQGHSCFRVRKTYRIPESSYGIHLFGDIVLGPRPSDNNDDRTVLSLHKYAHLIVDEKLRPLFKTAEEIEALKQYCGPSCIELILRNKERKAFTRATPVIAFKLGKGESSGIITGGTSAYIQYVSYANTAFESDRYISLLPPRIDGSGDNVDEHKSLVVDAVDIVRGQEQQQLDAAMVKEDRERKIEVQTKEKTRLSLLNKLASTHHTLDLFAKKLTDELLVEMKNVYPDLDKSVATNLTKALDFIQKAKGNLKAVKKTAQHLALRNNHVVTESQNIIVEKVVAVRIKSNFKPVTFEMLNQNVWGPADSDLRQIKAIAKEITVLFNNFAHVLSQLLKRKEEPEGFIGFFNQYCLMYWKNFLHHPNCGFESLKYYLTFMNCCVVPVTQNKSYNLFLDMEREPRAAKRLQEFHIHFWEAICTVANSYGSDNDLLFTAPSYAAFKKAIDTNNFKSILVRKNRDAVVGHGRDTNEDEDEEGDNGSSRGDDGEEGDEQAPDDDEENQDKSSSHGEDGEDDVDEEEAVDDGGDDGEEGDEQADQDKSSSRGEDGEEEAVDDGGTNGNGGKDEGGDHEENDEAVVEEGNVLVDLSRDGNDDFQIKYVTGYSPIDLLPEKIYTRLDTTFLNIRKKINNLSCYTQCAAIDCMNVIDESKGVCQTCNVSKFCNNCTTQGGVCCQTCNYLVDESVWIKAFPSLSTTMDDSCWQMSMEKINNDPKFPKTNGTSKAWSKLTKDEIENYTEVSYADVSKIPAVILKIFGDDDHTLYGSTMFRIMHERCWISEDTHDAIVAIMNDSYSQYYVDQLLRDDSSSSSNSSAKVHKYLNMCV